MDDKPLDETTRHLLSELDGAPAFPREEIRARLRSTLRPPRSRWPRIAGAVAASVLLFALGIAIGRWSAGPGTPSASPVANLPVSIQSEGTEYVAAVTRFAQEAGRMTPIEREQAREASLAVMHGAAWELLQFEPDDPVAGKVFELVSDERAPGRTEVVSF